jgi:hypothetical protein
VKNPELTDRIIAQGRALVRAIEALGTIEPTGPTERVLAGLLLAGYKRRLRVIIQHPVRKRPARRRLIRRPVGRRLALIWKDCLTQPVSEENVDL